MRDTARFVIWCLATVFGFALVGLSAPVFAQAVYQNRDGALTIPIANQGQGQRTIEVTDDFIVDGQVSFKIDFFATAVSFIDIRITAPDGTSVNVTASACGGGPISFGSRIYAPPLDAKPPTIIGGTAATYTFADEGMPIGQRSGGTSTACDRYWDNMSIRPPPDWPEPGVGDWSTEGAVIKLPPSNTYAPHGQFADFDGLQAKGVWAIEFTTSLPNLANTYYPAEFIINSVALSFGNGQEPGARQAAKATIQNFMGSRAARLLSDDLNLKNLLETRGTSVGGAVLQNLDMANNAITAAQTPMLGLGLGTQKDGSEQSFSLWARSSYQRTENPSGDVDNFIGHVGLAYRPNSNVALGLMVTMDHTRQKGDEPGSRFVESSVEGAGWLAGPYLVAQLSKGLTFTGRAQWGRSENSFELANNAIRYQGEFDTDRFLVKAELIGENRLGRWLLEPSLKFGYTKDSTAQAVTMWSTLSGFNDLGSIDVSEGRLEFAQKVSYPIQYERFTFVPGLKISGAWMFNPPDTVAVDGTLLSDDGERYAAKIESELKIRADDGGYASASIFYEATNSEFDSFGVTVRGKLPLSLGQ